MAASPIWEAERMKGMNNKDKAQERLQMLRAGAPLLVMDFIRWTTAGVRQSLPGDYRHGSLASVRDGMLFVHHNGQQVLKTSYISECDVIEVARRFWMVFRTASGSEYWLQTC